MHLFQIMTILILEPFYGGSHKQLIDILTSALGDASVELVTQPAKKWHWRARTSALWFSQNIPTTGSGFSTLFCSSVLNVCELVALRPDLAACRKVVYFHENQLAYPVQTDQLRDVQYGYNQILTALVADVVCFNSQFNMNSFLANVSKHFKLQPDCRPKFDDICNRIAAKACVVYFPIYEELKLLERPTMKMPEKCLHIVWPHRWEHDKNPEAFFKALYYLKDNGYHFSLSVLGETFSEIPQVFSEAKARLCDEILHFGFVETRGTYYEILREADVVVSTAMHEFFGVSMLEAAYLGCFPLVPNRLVYPEIFPAECIYNTDNQLAKMLRQFCSSPERLRNRSINVDFAQFRISSLTRLL
jgi:glycosyltransferase involved in cell wall biosynthesis